MRLGALSSDPSHLRGPSGNRAGIALRPVGGGVCHVPREGCRHLLVRRRLSILDSEMVFSARGLSRKSDESIELPARHQEKPRGFLVFFAAVPLVRGGGGDRRRLAR